MHYLHLSTLMLTEYWNNLPRYLAIEDSRRTMRRDSDGNMSGGWRTGWRTRSIAVLSLALLAACGTTRAPSPGDNRIINLVSESDRARLASLTAQRIAQQSDPDQGYRIGPDDLLEIAIPDLINASAYRRVQVTDPPGPGVPPVEAAPIYREGVRVSAMGDITVPQLGTVIASGHTARGLEVDIARRLRAAGILHDPQVSVTVVEHRSNVVAVVGSVQRPGLYPLTRPSATISDLIWASGGPSREAGRIVQFTPATVDGSGGGSAGDAPAPSSAPIRLDLEQLLRASEAGVADLNAPVRPGDVISIAPAGVVLVDGWVLKPGAYNATRNLTLTGAIASAGGLSFAADRSRATIKRTLSPTEEYYTTVDLNAVDDRLEPDVPIIDGDVVYLPASGPRLVPWGLWQFVTSLFRVGASVVAF
jgi:polysaccharide export outer membrane protein